MSGREEHMSDELPQGWAECELCECVDVLDNQRVPVNSDERAKRQGDVPYYGATGQVGWIDDFLFNEELLLIGEDGAPYFDKSKPIAYIIKGQSWVNNHAHVLRAKSGVSSNQYLKHLLDWIDFHEYVNGTTRLKLTQGMMNRIPVRLAPLAEQQRIIAKLEKLLGKVDACQKRLAKIPVILKRFRQSVLAAACSGRLTAEWREQQIDSEEWTLLELFEVSERIQIGPFGTQLHKADYIPNGIPLINPMHIQGAKIVHDSAFSISKSKYRELGNYVLQANDIIMGRRGEMGRCALISEQESGWLCGTGSLFVRPASSVLPEFLFLILRGSETKAFLESESKGTTMANLNLDILKRVPVLLPSLPEQQEIVRRVEALFALADQIEARYAKAKAYVDKLTQSILAKAFRGELVPQDPNDESASVLLERIRAERHKTEKKVFPLKSNKNRKYKPEMPKDLPMVAEGKVKYRG